MNKVRYTETIGEFDRLSIEFTKHKGKILKFVVQFYSLIDGQYRDIMRIDNYHGTYPHIHKYYYKRKQFKEQLSIDNPNEAFNYAKKFIKNNAETIKENFFNK